MAQEALPPHVSTLITDTATILVCSDTSNQPLRMGSLRMIYFVMHIKVIVMVREQAATKKAEWPLPSVVLDSGASRSSSRNPA